MAMTAGGRIALAVIVSLIGLISVRAALEEWLDPASPQARAALGLPPSLLLSVGVVCFGVAWLLARASKDQE
jgi:hypothetical protein